MTAAMDCSPLSCLSDVVSMEQRQLRFWICFVPRKPLPKSPALSTIHDIPEEQRNGLQQRP